MSEFAINAGEAFNDVLGDLVVEGPSNAVAEDEMALEQCNTRQEKTVEKPSAPPIRKVANANVRKVAKRPTEESCEKPPNKKFIGRCRLLIGNLPRQIQEAELKELFTPHGDISECYLSDKGVAFLRMDTPAHAESAKEALDGKVLHENKVFVRFAIHRATIKLKELAPVVTNEMLEITFSAFGRVERALHIVDAKGNPTGEGIVEFEKKSAALAAISVIKDRIFLLTTNSRPLYAEMLEPRDEEGGLAERLMQKTENVIRQRATGPRFAKPNSFDSEWGQRWKKLYEDEQIERDRLNLRMNIARQKLQAEMDLLRSKEKTIRPEPAEPPARRMPAFQAKPAKRAKASNVRGKPQGFFNANRANSNSFSNYDQYEGKNQSNFNGYQAQWSSSQGWDEEPHESETYAQSNNYYGGNYQVDNTLFEEQYLNSNDQNYYYES